MQTTLSEQKTYKMPDELIEKVIDGKILVISSETANWILLDNEIQLSFFHRLSEGATVGEAMSAFGQEHLPDLIHTLTELEAKRFEDVTTKYPPEQGLYVYLTNVCNQRCRHCYMYAGQVAVDELDTREVKALLCSFAAQGGAMITLTGGESTTRTDFIDITRYAKEQGLTVCVLSNGLLWSSSFIRQVKDSVDEVQISIDGFDRESYRSVRGTDSFECVMETVASLKNESIRVSVAVTPLMETLISHENDYVHFARSLREELNIPVKFNMELMDGRDVSPTREENQTYRECVKRITASCTPFSEQEGFALDHRGNTLFHNCGYGGLSVAANGDVYFCNLISKCAKQGNIRIDSFSELLERSRIARHLSDVRNLIPCKDCELKFLCGGGCRVKCFHDLVMAKIDKDTQSGVFSRDIPCTKELKESFYRLMISANAYFYR